MKIESDGTTVANFWQAAAQLGRESIFSVIGSFIERVWIARSNRLRRSCGAFESFILHPRSNARVLWRP
ncbi:hypothetical protein NVSP9465_03304 [Novosphingobium sp. CECT 9465]|nr:hypothetical protein NVSP9465_03304 [Novosphingobium sp. CECT 9465]